MVPQSRREQKEHRDHSLTVTQIHPHAATFLDRSRKAPGRLIR
jgi:hypothetical protein